MADLAWLARGSAEIEAFHTRALVAFRDIVPYDSAVLSEPGHRDGLSSCGFDRAALELVAQCETNYARFEPELRRGLEQARRAGGFLDTRVYSARERRELSLFCEVVRPQGVRSAIVLVPRWRRRILGNIRLHRHGRQAFSETDLQSALRLLPIIALGLSGLRSPCVIPSTLPGLTARGTEIVQYVTRGLTTPQIGMILGTSPHTVRNQLGRIFDRIGVASRAELAAWCTRQDGVERGFAGSGPLVHAGAAKKLGEREALVAHHVARGLTTPQIAAMLGTSPLTVRNQIGRIFGKLGVGSRSELAARLGQLSAQPRVFH